MTEMTGTYAESTDDELLPLFTRLAGRRVVVIGAGAVAAAKVRMLRRTGARITVVAPVVPRTLARLAERTVERGVRAGDLDGAWLVVSAATPAVNRRVTRAAQARRIFVNAVDDPANASAYLGGTLRRGGVTIAISTDGRAPALAGLLREAFERLLPDDLGRWMRRSDALRKTWRRARTPMAARRPALASAILALYGARPARRTRRRPA
jgi:uroporphyrin-III C-methyltransferase/precorrin-2 dehydrogenase/sirohydrochlorin ferrochelatase